MDLCDKTDHAAQRAENVGQVLRLLLDLLCSVEPKQNLNLSPEGVSGLTLLLLACIDTLEPME